MGRWPGRRVDVVHSRGLYSPLSASFHVLVSQIKEPRLLKVTLLAYRKARSYGPKLLFLNILASLYASQRDHHFLRQVVLFPNATLTARARPHRITRHSTVSINPSLNERTRHIARVVKEVVVLPAVVATSISRQNVDLEGLAGS